MVGADTLPSAVVDILRDRIVCPEIQVAGKYINARCMFFCLFFGLLMLMFVALPVQLLVMIALTLNGANLYGYVKCNYGAESNLNSAASDFVKTQLFKGAVDLMSKPSAQPTTARPTGIV